MRLVQPIRDRAQIEAMKTELLKKGLRDYFLFVLGINTGLRVSDLLSLRVKDVRGTSHIRIAEKKTGKIKRGFINQYLSEEIETFTRGMNDEDHLFMSQKGDNQPISRVQAYRILRDAARAIGLEEVGTHTLRKTFGYWHYQQYRDVALLQELFNHSSPSVTLRYIGINQDLMDETIRDFRL